jgi:amino acid transporter
MMRYLAIPLIAYICVIDLEVCCLAAEAKNPHHTLPRAVFGTIGTVTVLYALASLSLVGMVQYQEIDRESGFSVAFKDRSYI